MKFKWIVLGIDTERKVLVNSELPESPMGEAFAAELAVLHAKIRSNSCCGVHALNRCERK
jgi:hypothetical protein